ncbi:MAG: type II/IV secretion system ATPase subunit [Dehalococcoidia bacterium]|nr:type II/IV secretion system ATPase subunit [Dehalococcoidia bacterium]
MPNSMPFPCENVVDDHKDGNSGCALKKLISKELLQRAETAPHLMDYLHMVPMAVVGVPDFYPEISRKLGEIEHPNLIYPVSENVFVHIYPDVEDPRNYYLAVEPPIGMDLEELLREVERRLLDYVDILAEAQTTEERIKALSEAVEHCCVVRGESKGNGGEKKKGGRFSFGGSKEGRIPVTGRELETIKYIVLRDKITMGALQPLIKDTNIEDISCSGLGPVFVEHKIFKGLKSSIIFDTHEELDDFVIRLSENIKKPVTFKNPIVDAALQDGSRINIVYGGEVSKRGSNFTIRKFAETPISILDLINFGSMDHKMAAYLAIVVGDGLNLWVSGETASGKTTLLNAITTFIRPDAKIVSIEDTPELQVPHTNWIREVVRMSGEATQGASVDMFGLLKAALRQRPNAIIVGEIRGEEGAVAFQAMQTGHQVMSTFHASTVEKLIQRLTGNPINVPKPYMDNLNLVVICSAVRLPNGKLGRRVLSINEIIGYDLSSDSFSFVEAFRWNPAEDEFEFTGNMNSYLLENRVAPRRGLTQKDKRKIYLELDKKAAILEKLQQQSVTDFYDLYQLLAKAQREGLF